MNEIDKTKYLLNEYGDDFFAKCKRYKTAKVVSVFGTKHGHDQEIYVALLSFNLSKLTFRCRYAHSAIELDIPVTDLDGFVL